ncbi:hypothetical protein FRC06_010220, partial [Ceratobasidium sp. 370]
RPRGAKDQDAVQGKPEPDYSRQHPATSGGVPLNSPSFSSQFVDRFMKKDWNVDTARVIAHAKRRALVIAISYGHRSPPIALPGTYGDAYRIINLL